MLYIIATTFAGLYAAGYVDVEVSAAVVLACAVICVLKTAKNGSSIMRE